MKKIDELVKRVEFFERLAVYGDRKSFLKRIAEGETSHPGDIEEVYGKQPQTLSETTIVGNPPVSKKVQEMLNQLLAVQRTEMVPMPVDGELGPKTREAFKTFQRIFGKPGTPEAVAQVYNAQNRSNQVVDLEPAAKSRNQWIEDSSRPPGTQKPRT